MNPARPESLTCREFADFLADYLEGELSASARTLFDDHLAVCPNCQRYLDSYAASVDLARRAFEQDSAAVPADVPEELIRAILAARTRH